MRDDPEAVMIFAAGFGTRMGALTAQQPKPMVKVAGRALIDHTLDLLPAIAPKRVVANLHYRPERLRDHLHARGVVTCTESPDILDTGGGLRHALPQLGGGPVYSSNCDAIWRGPNPFAELRAAWRPEKMEALLLCVPQENVSAHAGNGDFTLDADGRITRGPGMVYSGIQILKTDALAAFPEEKFSLNRLWDRLIAQGTAYGVPYSGQWCDVGTPEGIAVAEALLDRPDV
ncbi:nucleotidyltransferase family protein [Cognatishimia sp. SS12]|uniref:nucleotidyltransferase family protein n=1 Tax=Cognatishimia sp. SS12 TaxID=2979465 RepID=UPI00232D26FE|nr:nucleotidyltransferase family protein [Cognatishimia sp. SS12]MDC0737759.1 nucleotidyltransferase family protein [Cognatishimia sp. SS12]